MSYASSPPRVAERLLTFVVRDGDQRDAMIGDLREEFVKYARRVGTPKAARWHWRQSVSIATRYSLMRLFRRKPPVRWTISMASMEADGPWYSGMTRDVLYAWRAIRQRAAVSAVVVMTLATALAANSTTFSILDALVLRPYRFEGVDRLMVATIGGPDEDFFDRLNVSAADFREWQEQSRTVKAWALYRWWEPNLSGVDIPEQVPGFEVSPGYFSLLGVKPILGREFLSDESKPGQGHRVVLGHALWTRRFASDPNIVGKSVRFNSEPYEVVGVAPPGFSTPDGSEVWAPLAMTGEEWANRRAENLGTMGKLADGMTVDAARTELSGFVANQRRDHPDTNSKREARVLSFTRGMADPGAGPFIGIWQVAAMLLLLIACANIANLLMARGAERSSEYALRLALGAGRGRLFAQTLIEGVLLAGLALTLSMPLIAIGLGISRSGIPVSVRRFIPGWGFIRIDLELFAVTALLGTAAMIIFSLLPAFQAMRAQVSDTLRQSGRSLTPGRQRQVLRSALAVTQIALALALIFASTLAISGASNSINGALGFDKNGVLTAQLNLPERNYQDAETRRRFINDVIDAMRSIPAVASIGAVNMIPAAFNNTSRRVYPEGRELKEAEARTAEYRTVTPDYLATLKTPVLLGRGFNSADRVDTTPVAIVSTAFAHRYWGNDDPIGKRFKLATDGTWLTVIGVSGNIVHNWFVREDQQVYRPISQDAPYSVAFALRAIGDPTALAGDLRRAIAKVDAEQPIAALNTLDHLIDERVGGFAFIARALGVVGMIAFALALMGIYSLMAFLTAQRTQEIGVRMALGAGRWQVIRATTARALVITLAGLVIGAALAMGIGRAMQSIMFGLITTSLVQLTVLVAVLGTAALLAAYLPARRAAQVDPMTALRES